VQALFGSKSLEDIGRANQAEVKGRFSSANAVRSMEARLEIVTGKKS